MKTEADRREELIQRQLTLISDGKISTAIQSWQTLAVSLTAIVGEDGFLVLYVRSLHLLRAAFPALLNNDANPSSLSWLADLENTLTGLGSIEAHSANHQLLMTFTNILASLIGEDLTAEILHSTWGAPTANSDPAIKEVKDDK